jgi:hypothetical protein
MESWLDLFQGGLYNKNAYFYFIYLFLCILQWNLPQNFALISRVCVRARASAPACVRARV